MLHLSYAGLSFAIIATLTESSARGRVHRIFMARPLRALGLYSYALYVFHFPIAILIQKKLFSELPRTTGSALMPELRYIVVAGGMSFAAAWLSWHLFEKHFLKLKDRFRHPRVQAEQQGASALTTAAPTARSAAAADGPSAPHSSNT
jgi:peptidoglycan/LPS O-acetylase OafA/YrhL